MLCRKQLGLLALGFALLHAIYTLIIPARYSDRQIVISNVLNEVKCSRLVQTDWSVSAILHKEKY